MKVVHISATPLAGSPIRIVNALNKYTDIQARSINLNAGAYGTRTFPEDLIWTEHREMCESIIRDADILHFHHWFDFASIKNPFGFDFLSHMKQSAKYLMHWHSNPMAISSLTGQSLESIVNANIPQMVVAQFHESYYPNAYPVPLIVEVESLSPSLSQRESPVVFFSPSRDRHAYEDRWETKGKKEVLNLLDSVKRRVSLDYQLVENIPFADCLQLRSDCDIVIDDIITGAFHTTALEGLAAGKPTLSYLDARTQMVLSKLTGTTDVPIVNARYFEAEKILVMLAKDKVLREQIGQFSRDWMLEYYSEEKMVAHYVDGYKNLLEGRGLSNERYNANKSAKLWLYNAVPDLIWQSRRQREMSLYNKIKDQRRLINLVKTKLNKNPRLKTSLKKIRDTLRYMFNYLKGHRTRL